MQNKKWISLLVAFLISIGLWVYVVTVENPVKEITLYNVPVNFLGQDVLQEDYDLLVTDSNALGGVNLTFSGKISDLNKLQQSISELELQVDIGHLRNVQDYSIPYDAKNIIFPSSVSEQNISLVAKKPNTLSLTLGKLVSKTVPVKVQQSVSLKDSYTSGRLTQSYDEITVEGTEELVKQVAYAQAVLERENVSQTVTANLPLTLMDENGQAVEGNSLFTDVTEIEITLPVLLYKDVPLEAPVIDGGGATSEDVVIDISPKTIRISGDAAVLESIQSIRLPKIDLSSLMSNDEKITRTITVPEDCENVNQELEAEVSVKIKNKGIRQIKVSSSNFQNPKGLPAEMGVNYKTTSMVVTIRANEKDIDQITEDHLRVVADFSEMSVSPAENLSVPVRIFVDGFEGAGAIAESEYMVTLDVVEK